jgi:hypothetical protein
VDLGFGRLAVMSDECRRGANGGYFYFAMLRPQSRSPAGQLAGWRCSVAPCSGRALDTEFKARRYDSARARRPMPVLLALLAQGGPRGGGKKSDVSK